MKRILLSLIILSIFVIPAFCVDQANNKQQREKLTQYRQQQHDKITQYMKQHDAEYKEFRDSLKGMSPDQGKAAVTAFRKKQQDENKKFKDEMMSLNQEITSIISSEIRPIPSRKK